MEWSKRRKYHTIIMAQTETVHYRYMQRQTDTKKMYFFIEANIFYVSPII